MQIMLQRRDALSLLGVTPIPHLALNTHQARLGHTQQVVQLALPLQDHIHQISLIRPIRVWTATSMALVLWVVRDLVQALDQVPAQQIKDHLDEIQLLHQEPNMAMI